MKHHNRVRDEAVAAKHPVPATKLVTVEETFGDWPAAVKKLFAQDALVDRLLGEKRWLHSNRRMSRRQALPGFGRTLGVTMLFMSVVTLLPLAAMVLKTSQLSLAEDSGTSWEAPGRWPRTASHSDALHLLPCWIAP